MEVPQSLSTPPVHMFGCRLKAGAARSSSVPPAQRVGSAQVLAPPSPRPPTSLAHCERVDAVSGGQTAPSAAEPPRRIHF